MEVSVCEDAACTSLECLCPGRMWEESVGRLPREVEVRSWVVVLTIDSSVPRKFLGTNRHLSSIYSTNAGKQSSGQQGLPSVLENRDENGTGQLISSHRVALGCLPCSLQQFSFISSLSSLREGFYLLPFLSQAEPYTKCCPLPYILCSILMVQFALCLESSSKWQALCIYFFINLGVWATPNNAQS